MTPEETKFELGPLQKEWVSRLRAHPERQMKDALGKGTMDKYQACCLGECAMMLHEKGLAKIRFTEHKAMSIFKDEKDEDGIQHTAHDEGDLMFYNEVIGLRSSSGSLKEPYIENGMKYTALTIMNDGDKNWRWIADYIESNPENVFTKSV